MTELPDRRAAVALAALITGRIDGTDYGNEMNARLDHLVCRIGNLLSQTPAPPNRPRVTGGRRAPVSDVLTPKHPGGTPPGGAWIAAQENTR